MVEPDRPRLRPAEASDERAIAALHADSWRRSYRGLLPDAYLDHEVVADRAEVWRRRFEPSIVQPGTVTVVAELDGELVGFAHSLVDDDPEWGTLLDNLHVRHATKRSGIGRRLVAETAARLLEGNASSGLYLWVLEENAPARAFYDALGGVAAGRIITEEGGASVLSLRYSWPDLSALTAVDPRSPSS